MSSMMKWYTLNKATFHRLCCMSPRRYAEGFLSLIDLLQNGGSMAGLNDISMYPVLQALDQNLWDPAGAWRTSKRRFLVCIIRHQTSVFSFFNVAFYSTLYFKGFCLKETPVKWQEIFCHFLIIWQWWVTFKEHKAKCILSCGSWTRIFYDHESGCFSWTPPCPLLRVYVLLW